MIKRTLFRMFMVLLPLAMISCASSNTESETAATKPKPPKGYSQKQDPSKIYGDEKLDKAYAEWAANDFPTQWEADKYKLDGKASWYGPGLNGNKTASGETFDMYAMTAAHKKLPFGTIVLVTNQKNGKSVVVRINDRGPNVKHRIIDMSYGAAYLLDMVKAGVVPVHIDIIEFPE